MARKTRKHAKSTKGVYSIPELRRAFEHVEQVIDEMIHNKESKANMISHIRKEWLKVFHKTLDKASADALITHRMESRSMKGGASTPIAGAPIDHVTRPGIYLDQGSIPGADGGLTTTVGGGGYGSYVRYIDNGFFNPEISRQIGPIASQSIFPLAPRADTGSNAFTPVKGGKRIIKTRKNKKTRGGVRLIPAEPAPSSPLFDMQQALRGVAGGVSPDATQRAAPYHLGSAYPKAVNISV